MGLTSDGFLAAVITAVVAFPLLSLLLWNRIPGPTALRLGSRLSLILLSQLSAVLLAALWMNNTYQLYTSWSDLMGDNGGTGSIQAAAPRAGISPVDTQVDPRSGQLVNAKLFTHLGTVRNGYTTTVQGPRSHVVGTVLVWLPPQYFEPAYAHTRFPVVQLLSGTPGTPQTWLQGMAAPQMLTQLITQGKAHPFVLVSASINVDPPHDPDCSDIPGGPSVATWLATDVRQLVLTSFRTSPDRDAWGLMGYSEGGLCASKLALQYPQDFAAAVSMSGDDHPDGDLLKPNTPAYNENSPLWLLQHRPPAGVSLLLTGTRQDGDIYQEANSMAAAAHGATSVETLMADRGGHNMGVWKSVEPQSFVWLSDRLRSPATATYGAFPELLGGPTG